MNKLIGIVLILFPISITLGEKSGLFRWDIHTDIDPINSNVLYQTSLGNTSTTSEDLDPKEIVSKMLEKLRELLKNGDKEHDLPSIDPYWFSMKREIEEENLQLNMSFDGQVSNTSNLFWNNLFTCPLTMQIQMELEVKDVFINGTYNLTGMAYEVLPVFGDGDFQINIEAVRLMLTTEVSPKQGDNPLEMDNLNLHFLDLRGLEMNFENLMGDAEVALLLSHLAADFSEKMAYNVVSDMEEAPNEVLYSIISDRIKQITLLEIVNSFNAI